MVNHLMKKILDKFNKKSEALVNKTLKKHQTPIKNMAQIFKESAKELPGGNQILEDLELESN